MAAPQILSHRRTQHLLLIQKILSLKAETSPFTLVLDTVEQGSAAFVREVVRGGKASKTHIIYVSHASIRPPPGTDTFIRARRKAPEELKKEILAAIPPGQKTLLILSTLPPTLLSPSVHLLTYLLSLLSPATSLLLIHHLDVPLLPAPSSLPSTQTTQTQTSPSPTSPSHLPYAPSPLTLLTYLATTILTLSSFPQQLSKKKARDHAREEPRFGLEEGREGVIVGMGANAFSAGQGIVLEMEHRRKSGRAVHETFFLPSSASISQTAPASATSSSHDRFKNIILLDDHPLFAPLSQRDDNRVDEEDLGGTFNLGLTEKQRRDREGVVLPYYDAQKRWSRGDGGEGGGGGKREGGEGGRILYEMGSEDDFDEEEDEI
ncbi:MAG: hypothetical protein Q9166_007166 [cf. Caloplaca sp. 2 TL-2023]